MATETKIIENGEVLIHRVYDVGGECYFDENGKLHRPNNKPAHFCSKNCKEYWVHGKLHRTDGPAIVYPGGVNYYYIDGVRYTKEDYWKEIERHNSK